MLIKLSISKINTFLRKLIVFEKDAHKLAFSCAIGVFIALSPFIGFHNIMIIAFSWLFKLNFLTVFTIAHINNPLTTIPLFRVNYIFGKWLFKDCLQFSFNMQNPVWFNFLHKNISYYIAMPKFCFWTFFYGSNILAIILALLTYPLTKIIFKKLLENENNCTK